MLSFSNRPLETGGSSFGASVSDDGSTQPYGRLSTEISGRGWRHQLLVRLDQQQRALIERVEAAAAENRHLLFYIHGFNNTLDDCLETMKTLEERYDVEVIAFDWPSLGSVFDYTGDEVEAAGSVGALKETLGRINAWLAGSELLSPALTANLMVHSMGNQLFKQYEESRHPLADTQFLTNITLVAADVTTADLPAWCDRITHTTTGSLNVIINKYDYALAASTAFHDAHRLGDTTSEEYEPHVTFVDLSGSVGTTHDPYLSFNPLVQELFERAFTGADVIEGLKEIRRGYYTFASSGRSFLPCAVI